MNPNAERKVNEAIIDGRLCGEFLNDLAYRRRVSPRTVEAYKSDLRRFADFLGSKMRTGVRNCSRSDVVAFFADCSMNQESARTRARRLSCLKGFFSFLKRKGRIDESPVAGMKGTKIPEVLPKVLKRHEMEKLIETGKKGDKIQRRSGMLLELMYATGMRISEAVKLQQAHLLLDEGIIRVESGKGGKGRLVPVADATGASLMSYMDEVRPQILGGGYSSWIFPTGSGRPIDRQTAWRNIKALGKTAGIETPLYPHLLRHTCATHLIENGCDLLTVQTLLGHADVSTTEIYTHILEEKKRQVFRSAHPRAV